MFKIDDDNNITITQGSSGYSTIEFSEEDEQAISENDSIKVQVRVKPNGGRVLFESTIDPDDLTWHIEPEDTEHIEPGIYYYDIRLELADTGDVFYVVDESTFEIVRNVTRGDANG